MYTPVNNIADAEKRSEVREISENIYSRGHYAMKAKGEWMYAFTYSRSRHYI
jgi:hypothetical protein